MNKYILVLLFSIGACVSCNPKESTELVNNNVEIDKIINETKNLELKYLRHFITSKNELKTIEISNPVFIPLTEINDYMKNGTYFTEYYLTKRQGKNHIIIYMLEDGRCIKFINNDESISL